MRFRLSSRYEFWPHHRSPPSQTSSPWCPPSLAGSAPRGDSVSAVNVPWARCQPPFKAGGGPCPPASPVSLPTLGSLPHCPAARPRAPALSPAFGSLPRQHLRRAPAPQEERLRSTPACVTPLHPSLPDVPVSVYLLLYLLSLALAGIALFSRTTT